MLKEEKVSTIEEEIVDTSTTKIEGYQNQVSDVEDNISSEDEAKELNTLGYDLYKNGDFEKALDFFEKSFEMDNDYVYAHYNYACTLGVLMKMDYPLWYESRDDIYIHLEKVVELKPNYIEKIKKDSDLDLLRKDFQYFKLLGYTVSDDEDIEFLLRNLDWHIPGTGIVIALGGMTFDENGEFEITFLNMREFANGNFDFPDESFSGTYNVSDGCIYFSLNEKMFLRRTIEDFYDQDIFDEIMTFKGYLDEAGNIIIEIFEYPINNYVDEFSA